MSEPLDTFDDMEDYNDYNAEQYLASVSDDGDGDYEDESIFSAPPQNPQHGLKRARPSSSSTERKRAKPDNQGTHRVGQVDSLCP